MPAAARLLARPAARVPDLPATRAALERAAAALPALHRLLLRRHRQAQPRLAAPASRCTRRSCAAATGRARRSPPTCRPRCSPTAIAYGGILVDAPVPILLCFRRTRLDRLHLRRGLSPAERACSCSIGVFSYLMTGAITIFFDPDWPRQLWRRWRGVAGRRSDRRSTALARAARLALDCARAAPPLRRSRSCSSRCATGCIRAP